MNTLTIIRHLAAVAAAGLTTTLIGALGLNVGPEQVAELQGALTTLGVTLLLALYAAIEKLLKPLFYQLGEPRAVEVDLQGLDSDVLSALAARKQGNSGKIDTPSFKAFGGVIERRRP